MATKTFKVSGMHCSSCEKLIDMELSELPGVKAVHASYDREQCTVESDGSVPETQVITAIETLGYKATIDHSE